MNLFFSLTYLNFIPGRIRFCGKRWSTSDAQIPEYSDCTKQYDEIKKKGGKGKQKFPWKEKKLHFCGRVHRVPFFHAVNEEHCSLTSSASRGASAGSEGPLPLEAALNISCPNSMAPPLLKVSLNVPCPSQPPRREN